MRVTLHSLFLPAPFLLALFVLATLTTPSMGVDTDQRQQIIDAVTELRRSMGEAATGEAVATDEQAFRDAVRRADQQTQAMPTNPAPVPATQPPVREGEQPCCGKFPPRFGPPNSSYSVPPRAAPGFPAQPGQYSWGAPPHPMAGPANKKRQLREAAFQLDQLAHRLEMSDLIRGADRVRQAAGSLREEARRISGQASNPHGEGANSPPGPSRRGAVYGNVPSTRP